MKKFLSAFLAILMVLSMVATSMVTVFAAEEAEEVHSILISNGEDIAADQTKDVKSHGWRNHNGHEFTMMELDGQKAAAITVKSNASSTTPRFHYYSSKTVDLTKFSYVEFDFYISDLAKMTDGFKPGIELSSAGLQDKAEVAGDVTGVEWKAGWNHVKVALADIKNATPGDAGDFDPTAWNFMRVLVGGTGNFKASEDAPLILAIDNFGFSDGTETPTEKVEPVTPLAPVVKPTVITIWDGAETEVKVGNSVGEDGWHSGLKLTEIGEEKRLAAAATLTGNENHAGSMVYLYQGKTAVDVSGMKYVEFDFYISDVTMLNTDTFCLELTSSGAPDVEETACEFRYDFKNGWNHVKVDFTDATFMSATGGTFDATQFDCFRFFTTANLACGEDKLVIAVDDLKFTPAGTNPQVVDVPEFEGEIAGWSAASPKWQGTIELDGHKGVYAATFEAGKIGGAGLLAQYNFGGKIAPIDITGMTHFQFDFYISDASAFAGKQICLELTSGGQADKEEINWAKDLNELVEGGLKNGWNTVKLEIASMGAHDGKFDATRWNFFRFHNTGEVVASSDLTLAFDNLCFTAEGKDTITATDCSLITNGWNAHAEPIIIDGKPAVGKTYASDLTGAGAMYIQFNAEKSLNISGMRYLEFDLYISDAAAWKSSNIVLEISSYNDCDKQERSREFNPWTGLVDGWNHITLHIGSQLNGTNNDKGSFSPVRFNYIRFFNQTAVPVNGELTVALKNIEFTTRQDSLEVNEYGEFAEGIENITFATAFGDLLDENNNNSRLPEGDPTIPSFYYKWNQVGINNQKYYADTGKYVSFQLNVENWKTAQSLKFTAYYGAQLLLKVSTDGENWTEVFRCKDVVEEGNGGTTSRGITEGYYTFDITDAVFGEDGKMNGPTVYIMVDDAYPAKGWGGNFYHGKPATLSVRYTEPKHEEKLPVPSTNVPGFDWATNLELNNTVSVSKTYKANSEVHFCDIYVQYTLEKGIDASKADAFVFDLYVSDLTGVKDCTVEIELASVQCDNEEKSTVKKINELVEGGIKAGWNTIVLPFDKLGSVGGEIDWSNIKWFRMYNHPDNAGGLFTTGENGLTLAIDNLRFTKAGEKVVTLTDVDPDMNNWHDVAFLLMNGERVFGKNLKDKFGDYALHMYYQNPEAPIDISSLKYLEFDIYFTDVDAIKDVVFEIELNSSGDWDKNDLFARKKISEYGFVDGWNHVKIQLSDMVNENGAFDATNLKWLRLFTHTANVAVDEFTFAFTNVRFTDDKAPVIDTPANPEGPETPDTPDTPDEPEDENTIKVPVDGNWSESWLEESFHEVAAQVRIYGNGGSFGAGGFMFMYKTEPVDISGADYLEFDVYVSDVSVIADVEFSFELTSGGDADQEEAAKKFKGKDTEWVNGWNHVKWNLKDFSHKTGGDFDATAWDFLRWYNDTTLTANGYFEVGIANVKFTADVETPDGDTKTDEYKFTVLAENEKQYLDPDFTGNINSPHNTLRFADGTAYFIYKYDLTSFRGIEEITFQATMGGQLHMWASADGKTWVEIYKSENNVTKYMTHDLSALAEAVATTATLYVKIGDAITSGGNGGNIAGEVVLTVRYDKNADQSPLPPPDVTTEHEKYEFMIGTDDEKNYLLNEGNSVLKTPDHDRRYADQTKYFIYKFDVKNVHQIEKIIFKAKAEAQMKLQVSVDKENWIDIDLSEYGIKKAGDRLGTGVYKFDITAIAEKLNDTTKTIYVKISDNKTDDGYGGCLVTDTSVVLDIEYTPLTNEQKDALEATKTEHSIPLWGANKTWGGKWTTDEENQLAGSGCISINLKGVTGTESPSKKFDAVDATGMDTIEFDIWISDLKVLEHLKNNTTSGSIEICSGGNCDQGEKAIGIPSLVDYLTNNNVQPNTWTHVAFELAKLPGTAGAYGEFTVSNIDYIRFFWTGMTDCGEDLIMKLDNFRVTDAKAQADQAAQDFIDKVLADNAGLIADIEALKNITAITEENYSSAKAKLSNVKGAFEALAKEAQDVLVGKAYKKPINDLQKLVDAYEAELDTLKDNKALIDELEALAAYKDAASITAENIDTVKAAIKAAQEKVDALDAATKKLLTDKGYVANIAAAQAAVDAYVPPKKGCGGALTMGAVATMILAGAWVSIAARKKED